MLIRNNIECLNRYHDVIQSRMTQYDMIQYDLIPNDIWCNVIKYDRPTLQ